MLVDRFLFCRMLVEPIYSQGDALVTKGNTERQQRNRAFAAEFIGSVCQPEGENSAPGGGR